MYAKGNSCNLTPPRPLPGQFTIGAGPNQFSYTGATLTLNQMDLQQSGEYYLQAEVAGCKSDTASIEVVVNHIPDYEIVTSNSLSICQGETTALKVAEEIDFQYQWFKSNQAIQGATSYNFDAAESGSYHIKVISSAGCSQTTASVDVLVIEKPNVSFTVAAPKFCANEEITFTNSTTFNNSYSIAYNWKFGDGGTTSMRDPKHIYAEAKNYTATLTATYENYNCSVSFDQVVQISDLPQVEIITNADIHCEGDSVLLSVNADYPTILWSEGQVAASIYVSQGGEYGVEVTNAGGCQNSAKITISSAIPPEITVSADKTTITSEESAALLATGGINYIWSPAAGLSNATIDNPIATPLQTTVYKVTGTASNGCTGSDSVKIHVKQIINIDPKNMFSPNNDGIDDMWEVSNIENYPDCKISIFNLQGKNVYEAHPYLNNWNGSDTMGKPLLEGVYYYTIRCNGSRKK